MDAARNNASRDKGESVMPSKPKAKAKSRAAKPKSAPVPGARDIFKDNAKANGGAGIPTQTRDGFDNFVSRVGLNNDNSLSAGSYYYNLVTRNRILLELAYRGSWIVGRVVDCVAQDMTRAGLDITTAKGNGDLKTLNRSISKLKIWQSLAHLIKWGRLYGGAIGVLQIEGQKLDSPLNLDTVGQGQFKGIVVYDRWQLNPSMVELINSGPDLGLPAYYDITTDPRAVEADAKGWNSEYGGRQRVHHSRVIRYTGIDLPYMQAITEMMWGESILERLWDRLISFDNASMSAASLIDRANLRTISIDKLREVIAAGGQAYEALIQNFEMIREFQTNEGLTLLDKEDVFTADSYTFAGLSDMLLQFAQQVSGAAEIPLLVLMSQAPAGLGATGDNDIRIYYDGINSQQEAKLRNGWEMVLKVMWRSEFGVAAPDDLEFAFTPLWQMSETDKANNSKTITETIVGAFENNVIGKETALQELKDKSNEIGLFSNITDEQIAAAKEEDEEEPPMPGEVDPATGEVAEPPHNPEDPAKKPSVSFGDDFKESDHPRKPDGKFGSGGGGEKSGNAEPGSEVNKHDKEAVINVLAGWIKDKDWDTFVDNLDEAIANAKVGKISNAEASKIKRSHNFTFETDPDNEDMHKRGKHNRGKEVKDPSIVVKFGGELYALDGQHRLNAAIREGRDANVAIVDGEFLKKLGVTASFFEGKKTFKDAIRKFWK
jgi:phage-related protein (TIGR01555 family)